MSGKDKLTIYYCGMEACESAHFFGPAVRPHYLMHFILKGKGIYRAGGHTAVLTKGSVFLIRPGEITYYQADEKEPWEYAWVAFNGAQAEELLEEYGMLKERLTCRYGLEGQGDTYVRALVSAFLEGGKSQYELLGYFLLIFSGIELVKIEQKGNYEKNYLQKAEEYMRHNYSYPIHISDIAKYVGIERTYLYKIFMKYKNVSPKQYLTEYRLMAAKDMLGNAPLSVTEVALSCGFHDSSSFCRVFKEYEGETPLECRRRFSEI